MHLRKSDWPVKRIVAAAMLVLSFIMFFLPWMNIYCKVLGMKLRISDLLGSAVDFTDLIGASGIIKVMLNGKISLFNAARIASYVGGAFDSTGVIIAAIVLWLLFAAVVLSFAFAVYSFYMGRERGIGLFPYVICIAVVLVVFIIATIVLNSVMADSSSEIAEAVEDVIGFSASLGTIRLFHLAATGFFSLIFALGAVGLCFGQLDGGELSIGKINIAVPEKISSLIPANNWTCPTCNVDLKGSVTRCPICNTPRPQRRRAAAGTSVQLGNWTCPVCREARSRKYAFCPVCGTRRPEKRRCAVCNSLIEDNATFCPYCGNRCGTANIPEHVPYS